MKNTTQLKKRFFAIASVLAISTAGLVAVPTVARAADPVCTNKVVYTECVGVTSDSAPYIFQIPAKFSGTFFLFSHGYRYPINIPASIPLVGGYTVTNTPVPNGGRNAAEIGQVALGMLSKSRATNSITLAQHS